MIVGEALFDRFPEGVEVLGGAPFNVAWHLHGFGAAPKLISRIGDDEAGQRVREAMMGWGMDISGLEIDPTHSTGAVDISFAGGQHTFDILPDQAYDHISEEQLSSVDETEVALFYQGTLIMRSQYQREILTEFVHRSGTPLFVDLNLRDPWWRPEDLPQLLHKATWLKVNETELQILIEQSNFSGSLQEAARQIQRAYRIELLILTLGADGAMAFSRRCEKIKVTPELTGSVVDTVGAGDAFASVALLGLLRNWPLETIMQRAQQFASRIVQQRGATRADRELYRQLLQRWV